jgi:predicted CXXCH cytochrome family protein
MWSAGRFMHFGEPLPDERFLDLIHLAYEKGIRTFFSADVYGTGEADSLLQRGDLGAPACNDCHGNHGPAPPGVARVSRSCSLCHSANASLFDGSKHKQAFDEHGWAECSKCHGNHAIAKTNDAMLATKPGSLCGDCHRQYAKDEPACIKTADYFHQTIAQLDEERSKLTNVSENLAAKGLDIEPISNQLNELTDSLKLSRAHIHSFSRNNFQQVAAPGGEAAQKARKLVTKARDEYRFRQAGLAASIAVIGLLMVTLYLKLRQLEKREE